MPDARDLHRLDSGGQTSVFAGSVQLFRYADLSGRPDKSAYADSRIMPPAWYLRWSRLLAALTDGIIGGLVRGS
jgi:hypothetical protein